LEIKVVRNNIEKALKDLKNQTQKDGLYKELKKRRYYEKPSVKEKNKRIEAQKKKKLSAAKLTRPGNRNSNSSGRPAGPKRPPSAPAQ